MTYFSRVCLVSLVTLYVLTGSANALTTSIFIDASDQLQQGYVFGMMEYMIGVASADAKGNLRSMGYQKCFSENDIDSKAGLDIVQRYLIHTADSSTTPMLANVLRAFKEACKRYLPD